GVVTATLVLREDVRRAREVGVRRDRAGLRHDLAALDVLTLQTTKQEAGVLARPRLVELLVEHLDTRDRGLLRRADADDLDLGVDRERAALAATRDYR